MSPDPFHSIQFERPCALLSLISPDGTNKLSRACLTSLLQAIAGLRVEAERGTLKALIITGNEKFFSAGADLNEIAQLSGAEGFEFARLGQSLTRAIDCFPVPVIACVQGYCFGGGLDLALACDLRIAAPNAVFGHRGATLGLMTGWGGTQRLPRLIGKARALEMFLTAGMVGAGQALSIGLVDAIDENPVERAKSQTAA
jgi:enoyl-CoA hydratase/carnithine racemase